MSGLVSHGCELRPNSVAHADPTVKRRDRLEIAVDDFAARLYAENDITADASAQRTTWNWLFTADLRVRFLFAI